MMLILIFYIENYLTCQDRGLKAHFNSRKKARI
jgi:hypothetical protein